MPKSLTLLLWTCTPLLSATVSAMFTYWVTGRNGWLALVTAVLVWLNIYIAVYLLKWRIGGR